MLQRFKRVVGILLAVAFVVVLSGPAIVSAAEVQRAETVALKALMPSEDALLSVTGKQIPSNLNQALSVRNIKITDNTLIEIVEVGSCNATAIVATNIEGCEIFKNIIMAVDEDGEFQSLTDAEIAVLASSLHGGNATDYPFRNSFEIIFAVSFNAYGYSSDPIGLVQPQTAMFIYFDEDELYDVGSISMTYGCSGIEGYYTNGNFDAITEAGEFFRYDINLYRGYPNPRSYYSASGNFPSDRVILTTSGADSGHFIEYEIVAYRQSNNARVIVEDYIFLDLY